MNELQVFNSPEFGQVRSVVIDNTPWFVGADAAKALKYNRPADAIADHVDDEDKRLVRVGEMPTLKVNNFGAYVTQDEVPPRELTSDDYFRAASIVATCKNERLPYVLSYLKMAGISAAYADQLKGKDNDRDKYEVMRLLVKAYSEYGISDAAIGRATGLDRAQIRMYRTGERFPKAGRAEYIKAVVTPMMNDEE